MRRVRSARCDATFNVPTERPERALASAKDKPCNLVNVKAWRWLSGSSVAASRSCFAASRSSPPFSHLFADGTADVSLVGSSAASCLARRPCRRSRPTARRSAIVASQGCNGRAGS
jgi:hypothetical protein